MGIFKNNFTHLFASFKYFNMYNLLNYKQKYTANISVFTELLTSLIIFDV